MKSHWIVFCLSCLWLCGCCGTQQRRVSALERENSQLNGLVWEMEFQLESLEEENEGLKQRLADGAEDEAPTPSRTRPKRSKPQEAEPFDPGDFRPPTIEFPAEPSPEGTVPDSLLPGQTRSDASPAAVSVASHEEPEPAEPSITIVPPEEVSLDSRRIKRIELGAMIGTLHLDDKPGDDGLVIVVEPWDGANRMLADAADITVVLIDPAEPAETSRYAQWKFEAKEASKLFRDGDLPGLHLELPWPDEPPRHDQLHLFVRYTTSDGRKLEADSLVAIELSGRGRWVATETPRVRPYEEPIEEPAAPAIPQLLTSDSEAMAKPVDSERGVPVRTVSESRERPTRRENRSPEPWPENRVEPISNRNQIKALPPTETGQEREGEPSARQRPTWSPDRPW